MKLFVFRLCFLLKLFCSQIVEASNRTEKEKDAAKIESQTMLTQLYSDTGVEKCEVKL